MFTIYFHSTLFSTLFSRLFSVQPFRETAATLVTRTKHFKLSAFFKESAYLSSTSAFGSARAHTPAPGYIEEPRRAFSSSNLEQCKQQDINQHQINFNLLFAKREAILFFCSNCPKAAGLRHLLAGTSLSPIKIYDFEFVILCCRQFVRAWIKFFSELLILIIKRLPAYWFYARSSAKGTSRENGPSE